MEPDLLRTVLRAVRRLRGGSLDLDVAAPVVQRLVGGNLAGACRALALWADATIDDPRAADSFLRAYGLGRMPETRTGIGWSLRSTTGRLGISADAVDDLLRPVEDQLARSIDRLVVPGPWGPPSPATWVDPYPQAKASSDVRRQLQQVLYAAWADVPDEPVHECAAALLLYEQEHGLRAGTVPVLHREHRRRLRRLAWSMLTVARERRIGKQPDDVMVDLLLGPRRMAVVEHLPAEAAALLAGAGPLEADRVGQTLDYVRAAVRQGRAEAPELLGLLREAVARGVKPATPPAVTAGIAALATIVARERRHISGVVSAEEAIVLAAEAGDRLSRLPSGEAEQRRRHSTILHFGLRAAQEVAELHDALGDPGAAWRAVRRMWRLLRLLDPTDQEEIQSWRQQHLQTRSTLARHLAPSSRHADMWLQQADRDASRSLHLAQSEGLPAGYRLVPSSQLVAIAVARMRLSPDGDATTRVRHERAARRRLAQALTASDAVGGPLDRPTSSARLSVARRWWDLALLCGDPTEVADARGSAHDLVRSCTLPSDLLKLDALEAARHRGPPPPPEAG